MQKAQKIRMLSNFKYRIAKIRNKTKHKVKKKIPHSIA